MVAFESRGRARRVVAEALGFDELRPGQEEAIASLLERRDTLAVLPTGLGKSAIYQAAGVKLHGLTVVVSPLIALQKDQVEAIAAAEGLPTGGTLNSKITAAERAAVLAALAAGELEFLLLAPEQFASDEVLAEVRAAQPSLFVVDEAHCVTEWGHDFRPEYLALGRVIEELGHPVVLALTATAAPPVREAIVSQLGMRDPAVIVRGFDRPNIWLEVLPFADGDSRQAALIQRVVECDGPGVVYVNTRRAAEQLAGALGDAGVTAGAYHGALNASEREAIQDAFMAGGLRVIVATSAFGMGVDKPDVRFVFHAEAPESLDAYYQAVGRAGRDSEPAEGVIFYRAEDFAIHKFFNGGEAGNAYERSRVEMMRRYAESRACRREQVLSYFGEPFEPPCDNCDNCLAGETPDGAAEVPFPLQSRVVHESLGEGGVIRYEGPDKLVVLFDEAGYKTLGLDLVLESGLLRPA